MSSALATVTRPEWCGMEQRTCFRTSNTSGHPAHNCLNSVYPRAHFGCFRSSLQQVTTAWQLCQWIWSSQRQSREQLQWQPTRWWSSECRRWWWWTRPRHWATTRSRSSDPGRAWPAEPARPRWSRSTTWRSREYRPRCWSRSPRTWMAWCPLGWSSRPAHCTWRVGSTAGSGGGQTPGRGSGTDPSTPHPVCRGSPGRMQWVTGRRPNCTWLASPSCWTMLGYSSPCLAAFSVTRAICRHHRSSAEICPTHSRKQSSTQSCCLI